ncbi:MAG: hypothetical protein ACLPWD_06465 [Methanobacterium sp.]
MNKKHTGLFLLCSFAIITLSVGCRRSSQEVVIVEEQRVSGPLSDNDVTWSKEDYR